MWFGGPYFEMDHVLVPTSFNLDGDEEHRVFFLGHSIV